jgi:hypothetical protein
MQLRPLQIDAMVGENSLDTIADLVKITNVDDSLGFLRAFDDKFGKRQYLRGQLTTLGFRWRWFEFQPFGSNASWLELRNPTTPEASFASDTFAGAQLSFGFPLVPQLLVGATLRSISRISIAGTMGFTDIFEFVPPSTMTFDDYAPLEKGQGYGADLGMIWRPTPLLRLGLTVQNIGDTAFEGSDPNKNPPALKQSIKLGTFYRWKFGAWDLDLMGDFVDLMNREGQNLTRLTRLGAEFGRTLYGGSKDHDFGLTAGLNEGYLSAGAFIDAWVMRFDVSHYAVELGELPGQRIDRRWAVSLQSNISF